MDSALDGPRSESSWFRDRSHDWITRQDLLLWLYAGPLKWSSRLVPVAALLWLVDRLTGPYVALTRAHRREVARRMMAALDGHVAAASLEPLAREFVGCVLRKRIDDLVIPRLHVLWLGQRARVIGLQHLDDALRDGKGVIVVSPHFHANRVAKFYLRRIGYPILSVRKYDSTGGLALGRFGRRHSAPAFSRLLHEVVEDEVDRDDPSLGATLLRRLRRNGIIDTHVDTRGRSGRSLLVPFLAEMRAIPTGFLTIAERTGAPLVPMWCRGNCSAFEIEFEPPIRHPKSSGPEDFNRRIAALALRIQAGIRADPAQWEMWASRLQGPGARPGAVVAESGSH